MNVPQNAILWISGRDTGMSSKAIWNHMVNGDATRDGDFRNAPHPHDLDDLGRCVRLLDAVPAWRLLMHQMADYSAEWRALVENWDELEALYRAWWPLREPYRNGAGTKAWGKGYDRMRALLEHARLCADCGKRGMNAWTTYPGDVKRCADCADKHKEGGATTVQLGNATMSFGR